MSRTTRSILIAGVVLAVCAMFAPGALASSESLPGSKISGYVFEDGSGPGASDITNGMWDAGEAGFSGVDIGLRLRYTNGGGLPGVLDLRSTTTNAQGYYEFTTLQTCAYWSTMMGYANVTYEVYIIAFPGSDTYICTTGHDDPAGALLSKHGDEAFRATYGNVILAYPQVAGPAFNWPEGQFPGYRAFMQKNNAQWPTPPTDWSAAELAEYRQEPYLSNFWGDDVVGDHRKHVDFGFTRSTPNLPPASIGDVVWLDANRNDIQDEGEPGVAGAVVTLFNAAGTPIANQTTGADGKYLFTNLVPGTYTITFTRPAGYDFVLPNVGIDSTSDSDGALPMETGTRGTVQATLAAGQQDLTWDCGLFALPAEIGDRVWFDKNRNGLQDDATDEPGVAGVTVILYDADDDEVARTATDGNGDYLFPGLTPGDYSLEFVLPDGYVFTAQDAGDDALDSDVDVDGLTGTTTLTAGESDLTWDAGLVIPLAAIGDRVWLDTNKNGIQDMGEVGVSGVLVTLLDASGDVVTSMITDGDGEYLFEDLEPGAYSVKFELPSGYDFTLKNAGSDSAVDSDAAADGTTTGTTLAAGARDLTWDAGLVQKFEDEITVEKTGGKMVGDCHTIGFWKTNAYKIKNCQSGTQVSRTQYITWLNLVRNFYLDNPYKNLIPAAIPGNRTSENAALQAAYEIMSSTSTNWTAKTLKQLLATELNYVSGIYAMADAGAHEAFLKMAEDALNTPGANLEAIHNMADTINNLGNSSQSSTPVIGSLMAFTITVKANLAASREVEVRDYLDSCLSFVSASDGGQYVSAGRYAKWALTLPAGASTTELTLIAKITKLPAADAGAPSGSDWVVSNAVSFTVWDQLSASAPSVQFVPASWSGSDMGSVTFTCHPGNNKLVNKAYAKLGDEPQEPGDEPQEPGDEPQEPGDEPGDEPETPTVTITKAASKSEVLVGDTLIYTLKVTVANGPATVTIWDKLPGGAKLVATTPKAQYLSSKRTVVWKDVTLDTGDHYFLIKVKVESGGCSVEAADEASIEFTCGSSNGGKKGSSSKTKKQYIGDLCNTAYVGIGCKSIKSNTVKVKVYRYSSSCNWRC